MVPPAIRARARARACRRVHLHLRRGLTQCAALASMVVLMPLPWPVLLQFAAVSLPFCVLNSVRLPKSCRPQRSAA